MQILYPCRPPGPEEQSFREQLANYATTAGAKRGTNPEFAHTTCGACDQKISRITTGD